MNEYIGLTLTASRVLKRTGRTASLLLQIMIRQRLKKKAVSKKTSLLKPSDILFIIGTRSWTRMRRRLILLRVRTARTRLLLCAARAKSIYSLSNGILDTVWPVPLFLEDGDILGS